MALPGSEKKDPHAFSTCGSVNAISRPPRTRATTMARIVTTTELPSRMASITVRPNCPRPREAVLAGSAAGSAAAGVGGDAGSLLLASLRRPPGRPPRAPYAHQPRGHQAGLSAGRAQAVAVPGRGRVGVGRAGHQHAQFLRGDVR